MLEAEFSLESPLAPAEPGPAPEAVRDECLARASVYRLLGGVFAEEPSAEFVTELRSAALLVELARAGLRFDDDFLAAELPALVDALACEYTTLFASSGGFPPVESVRLTGRFKQDPASKVAAIYQRLGFEVHKVRFEVFPDQLGVELAFVAALLERCAAALDADDQRAFDKLNKEVRRFWTLHLGRWVRGYAGLVQRASQHSFYREMARFLRGFAEEEVAAMDLRRLEDLDQGRAVVPKSEIKVEFDPNEPVCGACPSGRGGAAGAESSTAAPITVHKLHDLRL